MLIKLRSLSQLDDDYIRALSRTELDDLSSKLVRDLKEAHERLIQNSRNSSRPPSSWARWESHEQGVLEASGQEKQASCDEAASPRAVSEEEHRCWLLLTSAPEIEGLRQPPVRDVVFVRRVPEALMCTRRAGSQRKRLEPEVVAILGGLHHDNRYAASGSA